MKLFLKLSVLAFVIGLFGVAKTNAVYAETFPNKPLAQDFFVDGANLINDADKKKIDDTASALLKEQGIPLFVVTIPSLSAFEATSVGIEGYAKDLFNHWGIGSKEKNYGILLLVSVGDRDARIEFGEGFEHKYDSQAGDIMQSLIVPAFKRGDFSTGIADGVKGLDAMARGLQLPQPTPPKWLLPAMIIGLIGLAFLIFNLFKTGRSGWAWALIAAIGVALFFMLRNSGRGGGSAGGFGGGFSGGGGATGSW